MTIIMNPPYNRSLHLKILREAMKHSDDIVNLSPIRWLQDPLAEYKKNSDWFKFADIRDHIESLEVVEKDLASKFFSIVSGDLGIYRVTKNAKGYEGDFSFAKKIINKTEKFYCDYLDHNKTEYWCPVMKFHWTSGDDSFTPFDLTFSDNGIYAKSGWTKGLHDTYEIIYFDTEDELKNFKSFLKLKSYKWILGQLFIGKRMSIYLIPFMHTYKHPWTDEMLYEYFGLTEEEIKEIEKCIL